MMPLSPAIAWILALATVVHDRANAMTQAEIDIKINARVLALFQAQGDDWQDLMSAALKSSSTAEGWNSDGNWRCRGSASSC